MPTNCRISRREPGYSRRSQDCCYSYVESRRQTRRLLWYPLSPTSSRTASAAGCTVSICSAAVVIVSTAPYLSMGSTRRCRPSRHRQSRQTSAPRSRHDSPRRRRTAPAHSTRARATRRRTPRDREGPATAAGSSPGATRPAHLGARPRRRRASARSSLKSPRSGAEFRLPRPVKTIRQSWP